jgi:hypothetical protein
MRRQARTSRVWPTRWARSIASAPEGDYQDGSRRFPQPLNNDSLDLDEAVEVRQGEGCADFSRSVFD